MILYKAKNKIKFSHKKYCIPYGPLFSCKSRFFIFKERQPKSDPQERSFTWGQIGFILLAGSLPSLIFGLFLYYQTHLINESINNFVQNEIYKLRDLYDQLIEINMERKAIKKELFQIKSSPSHSLDILKEKVEANGNGVENASIVLACLFALGFCLLRYGL